MRTSNSMKATVGAVGLGLGLALFTAAAASAQGDVPAHNHYRLVAMAPRGGEGIGAGQGVGEGQANPPVKDDLFEGTNIFEKNATGVTEINMGPESLNLVGGPEQHKAHNTILNVVRTYSYDKPGMYNMADVETFRNKLNSGDWHCSVHTRDLKSGSSTDVCSKSRTDGLRETAIITVEPKSLTFIHTIRKAGEPGESEVGSFPMLYGMPGLPALAMLDPDIMLNLPMMMPGLAGLPGELGMIKVMPRIDSEEMARRMAEARKKLKEFDSPEMQKKLKEFNSPEMQKKFKDFDIKIRRFDSPEAERQNEEGGQAPPPPPAPPALAAPAAPAPAPVPAPAPAPAPIPQ